MAVTVQMQFESVVPEMSEDAFIGSSIENGTTIIQFDLRKHDFQQELGTQATLCWRKRSGYENLPLAISSAHGVPCRYGHAPDLPTGPLGTDATRSARVYWNA
jgi:hypothetical protein